jgi:hypothetical protein
LAQNRTFASHIGARNDVDTLFFVETTAVGREALADVALLGQGLLNDGVTAVFNL